MSEPQTRPPFVSHGTGVFEPSHLKQLGSDVVIEAGVLIFHPENISLGSGVYVGHHTMLKAYHTNEMIIGDGTWIGQMCFFHSAGGLMIGKHVGIGPGVKILTSSHELERDLPLEIPILHRPIEFAPVIIEDDADIGVGCILLPGVRVGRGAQVGAGSVVTKDIPDFTVAYGNPAKVMRERKKPT